MRQHPQFDLRIIGGDQNAIGRSDKSLTDSFAFERPNRNILQIGIATGESSCSRHCLVIGGMNSAGLRINQSGQRVNISGFEFGKAAISQNFRGQFMA